MPSTERIPLVHVQEVSCRIGDTQALQGITFALPSGARCVIAGPSGAGKTTLLRLLAGLQAPASGQLFMDGRDLTRMPPEARSLGWVGAEPGLLPQLDAVRQVELPLRLAGMDAHDRHNLAFAAMQSVGMGHRLQHRPNQLSSGEALRVALARAMVNRPRLLLLDEPLARIDPAQRTALRRVIASLQESSGCTVIETSHWLHDALPGASHVAILRGGRMIQFGDAAAMWATPVSPWVMDFVSILPNWWSPLAERSRRGWHGFVEAPPTTAKFLGVRLDLASWDRDRPQGFGLGPLCVRRVHAMSLLAHVEASLPDGEVLRVPLRATQGAPAPDDVGWAAFGPEAVKGFDSDDREPG